MITSCPANFPLEAWTSLCSLIGWGDTYKLIWSYKYSKRRCVFPRLKQVGTSEFLFFSSTETVWRIRDVYPGSDFFHPGSRIRTVSIPDPGSSSKNLSILTPKKTKKWFLSSKKYDPGCSSRIPDPDADFLPSRIPGSKRHPIPDPDPQYWKEIY
jgi:hypothetical protein